LSHKALFKATLNVLILTILRLRYNFTGILNFPKTLSYRAKQETLLE